MLEKLLDLSVEFFKRVTDKATRRKLCIIVSISGFLLFVLSKQPYVLYGCVTATVIFFVDIVYDKVSYWRLLYFSTGKRAAKKLGKISVENKKIIRDIYNSKSESMPILNTNGAKQLLIAAGMIQQCNNLAPSNGVVYAYHYCLQPWVRKYIDKNPDWLTSFTKGQSCALKEAIEQMGNFL